MLNIYDIIGYIATFLTVITGIPQLFKIIKTKKSNDISLHTFIILFIAHCRKYCLFIYQKHTFTVQKPS